jgi:hypothetical protein
MHRQLGLAFKLCRALATLRHNHIRIRRPFLWRLYHIRVRFRRNSASFHRHAPNEFTSASANSAGLAKMSRSFTSSSIASGSIVIFFAAHAFVGSGAKKRIDAASLQRNKRRRRETDAANHKLYIATIGGHKL